jgi:hypothetical protein
MSQRPQVNQYINHPDWGIGQIKKINGNILVVQFQSQHGIKMITKNSIDDGYIKLLNDSAKSKQENKIAVSNKESDAQTVPNVKPSSDKSIYSFHAYMEALDHEIEVLKKSKTNYHQLYNGIKTEQDSAGFSYSFETEDEIKYPDNSPVKIKVGPKTYPAILIHGGNESIDFSVNVNLGESIERATFVSESWKLLEILRDKIQERGGSPKCGLMNTLINNKTKFDPAFPITGTNTEGVLQGVMSERQRVSFVWGPPGTGKTYTLAKVASEYLRAHKSVLILSYSNIAVDGAIWKTYLEYFYHNEKKDSKEPIRTNGKMLRYGHPEDEKILGHPDLRSYEFVLSKNVDLVEKSGKLRDNLKEINRKIKFEQNEYQKVILERDYQEIRKELNNIRKELQDKEIEAINHASCIATTITKATIDECILSRKFDVVIVDEASMAIVPQIIFAASLAKKRFICFGDFNQLPAVVQSEDESVLHNDIFRYTRIVDAVRKNQKHDWLFMLNKQYRMTPLIAQEVSTGMYLNLLESAQDSLNIKNAQKITEEEPFSNCAIAAIDLSRIELWTKKAKSTSKINVLSAFLTFYAALKMSHKNSVGIVTPYNAQAALLHNMTEDFKDYKEKITDGTNSKGIKASTVHKFQGSEEDVILYDVVDCTKSRRLSLMMSKTEGGYADRLFNVALSRAKGKFLIFADMPYLVRNFVQKEKYEDLFFAKTLRKIPEENRYDFFAPSLRNFRQDLFSDEQVLSAYWDNNYTKFFSDILNSSNFTFDMPYGLYSSLSIEFLQNLDKILPEKEQRNLSKKIRTDYKNKLPKKIQDYAVTYHVTEPVCIIDKKIIWVWGRTKEKQWIAFRFDGSQTSKKLFRYLKMEENHSDLPEDIQLRNRALDETLNVNEQADNEQAEIKTDYENFADYISKTRKCGRCGRPYKLKKSKLGLYLGCSAKKSICDRFEPLTSADVYTYFHEIGGIPPCPECGGKLEVKDGHYGVYIQCKRDHTHQFDVRNF